jgi:hypothetical protein
VRLLKISEETTLKMARKIIKLIMGKHDVRVRAPAYQLRIGPNGWFCEDVNEA